MKEISERGDQDLAGAAQQHVVFCREFPSNLKAACVCVGDDLGNDAEVQRLLGGELTSGQQEVPTTVGAEDMGPDEVRAVAGHGPLEK